MNSERERSVKIGLECPSRLVQASEALGRWCQNWLQAGSIRSLALQTSGLSETPLRVDQGSPLSLSKLGDGLVQAPQRDTAIRGSEEMDCRAFDDSGIAVLDDFPIGKRVAEIVLIAVSAPVWLPVMGIIAGWIKMVSDGPVFFRQKRVGYGECRFPILKFRSMDAGADTEVHERHVLKLMREGKPLAKLDLQGDSRLIPWRIFAEGARAR